MRLAFRKARGSLRAERRILLAVIAGLLVGFLPLLLLRTEPAAATVRLGFEDRLVASPGDQADGVGLHTRWAHAHTIKNWQGASVQKRTVATDPGAEHL